jgi:hypothetical protein
VPDLRLKAAEHPGQPLAIAGTEPDGMNRHAGQSVARTRTFLRHRRGDDDDPIARVAKRARDVGGTQRADDRFRRKGLRDEQNGSPERHTESGLNVAGAVTRGARFRRASLSTALAARRCAIHSIPA